MFSYKLLPIHFVLLNVYLLPFSYLILAPTIMYAEKEPKDAAAKCFESIGLDPDSYRIGHTKARKIFKSFFQTQPQPPNYTPFISV